MKNYIIFWVSTFWVFQHTHSSLLGFGLCIMGLGIRKHFAAAALSAGSLLCPIPANPRWGGGMTKRLQRHSHRARGGRRGEEPGAGPSPPTMPHHSPGSPGRQPAACTPRSRRAVPLCTGAARCLCLPALAKGAACQGAGRGPRALAGTQPGSRLGRLHRTVAGAIPHCHCQDETCRPPAQVQLPGSCRASVGWESPRGVLSGYD